MEHQGQHGHGTTEYGNNPVSGHGVDTTTGVVGHGAGPGGAPPAGTGAAEEQRSRGILHRSNSSSSSSSSEDDGMGGRRKKGIKEKIKEKLPGGNKNKDNQNQQPVTGGAAAHGQQGHAATTGAAGEVHGVDATTGEKKGFMDKIKEKLPGHH
ncbi:hypothetical protein PR202_gb29379 [Eleusine coracana subsp. coracana]|uniref:Dehydrin n=1 Tax=Eleusine coracana subsp. coracana TaxID=191504 RepID=A0AAV5FWW9_ELECO|nr:hypothetical protein QOZ80_9BG0705190 [Eleusine coracana subsp. coracana]GJN40198.1 hypothetical protein PR202_gb29379 [Eleusine coracana subsp. coracana]